MSNIQNSIDSLLIISKMQWNSRKAGEMQWWKILTTTRNRMRFKSPSENWHLHSKVHIIAFKNFGSIKLIFLEAPSKFGGADRSGQQGSSVSVSILRVVQIWWINHFQIRMFWVSVLQTPAKDAQSPCHPHRLPQSRNAGTRAIRVGMKQNFLLPCKLAIFYPASAFKLTADYLKRKN